MTEKRHRGNPRYLSYCIAHGEPDPEKMLERDKIEHPTACMVGFLIWNQAEWSAWNAEHPGEHTDPRSEEFTAWQRARAEATAKTLES